jgi:hypothetical protein
MPATNFNILTGLTVGNVTTDATNNSVATSGNITAGNLASTGLASAATLLVSGTSNLGAIGNITITGGAANRVITTNGSGVLSFTDVTTLTGTVSSATANQLAYYTGSTTVSGHANLTWTGGNLLTVTGNISSTNISASGEITITGNANVGNIGATNANLSAATITGNLATGNTSAVLFTGNVSGVSGVFSGNATFGNINSVSGILGVSGNITGGNLITTGFLSASGNANVGNIGATNSIITANATFGNINSVSGILSVTGNANVGNIGATNANITSMTATGSVFMATTSGNVGIGTASPSRKLDVMSTDSQVGAFRYNTAFTATTNEIFTMHSLTSSIMGDGFGGQFTFRSGDVGYEGYLAGRIYTKRNGSDSNHDIYMEPSGSSGIVVKYTGNIGIGTTSPGGKLEVVGGRSFFNAASEPFGVGARYISTGGTVYFGATNGTATPDAQISASGGSALMTLLNGGNIGIGTASPGTKLEVFGSITARAATTQDSVILAGRAGGTSSYGVTLTPTTLTASRTVTLADGNTTLTTGTMAVTGDTLAQFASTTSAQLAGVISDETGSGALVFGTSPTFTTSAVIPVVNGGTTVSSTLTLQSTSGAGTSDAIIFKTASQSERMRILTTGEVGIGTTSPAVILDLGGGTNFVNSVTSYTGISPTAKTIQIYDATQSFLNLVSGVNTNGAVLGGIFFSRSLGQDDAHYNVAGITALQNSTGNISGGELLFYTKASSSPTEKMRINVTGDIIFGNGESSATTTAATLRGPARTGTNAAGSNLTIATGNGTGTGGSGSLIFQTASAGSSGTTANTLSERMRIDSSGNVGIGTASPKQLLHVAGQGLFTTSTSSYDPGDSAGSAVRIGYNTGGDYGYVISNQTGVASKRLLVGGSTVEFLVSGAEKGRFNSDGKFGIGTTSPLTTLQVGAVAALNGDVTLSAGTNMVYTVATSGAALTWNANTNGGNANTVMAQLKPRQDTGANYCLDVFCGTWNNNNSAGTAIATFSSSGNVGIGTTSPSKKGSVGTAGTDGFAIQYSPTSQEVFSVTANTGTGETKFFCDTNYFQTFYTNNSEKMRVNTDGYLLVGYTSSNGSYKLQVNSQIFATNATIATSDGQYKQNVVSLQSGLDVIEKLNPVTFNWKDHDIHNFESGTQVGFIAQEVKEVLADTPYLDSVIKRNELKRDDGSVEEFYGMADAKLIPVLVKAIQELKAEIDLLKAGN